MTDNPRRLLVVDDEPAIRSLLGRYFRSKGWSVDAVAGSEEAKALLGSTTYSVLIADLRLTEVHAAAGLDLVQLSRSLSAETRVVLLTGYATPEFEVEARRRGADAFLQKPLPLPELEAILDELLSRRS